MDYITVAIQPFVLAQTIFVYKNDTCVCQEKRNMKDLGPAIANLAKEYSIKDVHIKGGLFHANKLKSVLTSKKFDFDEPLNVVLHK